MELFLQRVYKRSCKSGPGKLCKQTDRQCIVYIPVISCRSERMKCFLFSTIRSAAELLCNRLCDRVGLVGVHVSCWHSPDVLYYVLCAQGFVPAGPVFAIWHVASRPRLDRCGGVSASQLPKFALLWNAASLARLVSGCAAIVYVPRFKQEVRNLTQISPSSDACLFVKMWRGMW